MATTRTERSRFAVALAVVAVAAFLGRTAFVFLSRSWVLLGDGYAYRIEAERLLDGDLPGALHPPAWAAILARTQVKLATRLAWLVGAGAMCVLMILPWFLFNLTRYEEPVPLSVGMGPAMRAGNCDPTSGDRRGPTPARRRGLLDPAQVVAALLRRRPRGLTAVRRWDERSPPRPARVCGAEREDVRTAGAKEPP